jgi:hypothetical protein
MPWPIKSSTANKQNWLSGICLITGISGYFSALNYYSFDISSDDALYFQRALSHFSVLEFSPHFPGYPGFVWLERLLQGVSGHATSNVLLSFISAIALSLSVFVYCYQRIEIKAFALFAVLLFLLQGNLADLAFNGLSDATALLFFSLYLFTQAHESPTSTTINGLFSGLLLAACLATRPSYLPLVVSALALEILTQRNLARPNWIRISRARLRWQLVSISIMGLICAGYIFIHDGWAYFDEARRFTQGHFTIWGNTGDQREPIYLQWLNALLRTYSIPGLVMLTASLIVGLYISYTRQLSILACCWLAWILYGQNPENIRHLAVLSLLLPIIFSLLAAHFFKQRRTFVIISMLSIVCTLGYHSMDKFNHNKHAPSEQARHFFQALPTQQTIISNYNIATLRDSLPQHVILDRHYQSSSTYLAKQGDYWQLSSTILTQQQPLKKFNGRFLGERPLYLYYYSATTTGYCQKTIPFDHFFRAFCRI